MAATRSDLRGSRAYLAGALVLLVVGLISAAYGWMFTEAFLFGSLVFFVMGVTRMVLRPKRSAGGTARRSGGLAAGSAGAWFAGTGDGGSGDGGSGGAAVVAAVVVAAAGVEPRMTGTWWRGRVPVVVTRCAPGRVPSSN